MMSSFSVGSTNHRKKRSLERAGSALNDCCIYRAANCCTFWSLTFVGFKRLLEKNRNKAAGKEYLMKVSFMQMWPHCTKAASLPYERYKDPEAAAGEKRLFRPFFLLFPRLPRSQLGNSSKD